MTRRLAAYLAAVLLLPVPARAHVVSDLELTTLRKLPPGFVRELTAAGLPDDAGHVRVGGRPGWAGIGAQCVALPALSDAAAWADTARAERAWLSLDAAFVAQRPDGWFEPAGVAVPPGSDAARATVVWTGEAARALVAMTNSTLATRFQGRVALLLPKLRRTVDRLAATSDALEHDAADDPGRLLALAQAFLLADGLYHEPAFNAIGQRALVAALARQHPDGGFHGRDGDAVARQADDLSRLETVTQYFPASSLERACDHAAARLAARCDDRGRLRGLRPAERGTTAALVARVLAYHAARRDDAAGIALARRVAAQTAAQ